MNQRRYLVEILGLYALVGIVGLLFNSGDWAFLGVSLHPYIVIAAVEAVLYGISQAMLASLLGVVLYSVQMSTQDGAGGNHAMILFGIVFTGLVLGLTQEARNRQTRELRSELEETRREQERLRQRVSVLNTANEELNNRILGEEITAQSFSELARKLSVLETDDIYPALCELVQEYLSADEASYYVLNGKSLELKAQTGWESVPKEAQSIKEGDGLLWTAIKEKKTITALDKDVPDEARQRDPSRRYSRMICSPVFHPQTREPIGLLSVDRMPFSRFHGSSVKVLDVLARWAGDSLHNAQLFQELRERAKETSDA